MEKIKRFILMAVAIVMIWSSQVLGQADQKTGQKNLFIKAIEARMRVMERRYHVKFDPKWVVSEKLIFEVYEDTGASQKKDIAAEYHSRSQCLFFNPDYLGKEIKLTDFIENIQVSSQFRNKLRELFDHELGHILADHLSRQLGNGPWPDRDGYKEMKWEEKQGLDILSEGIGSFFEYTSVFGEVKISDKLLPETLNDPAWQDEASLRKILYQGGHWLVRPVIKQFGERGIQYLVTNLFTFEGNARAAARAYQDKAIEELSGIK